MKKKNSFWNLVWLGLAIMFMVLLCALESSGAELDAIKDKMASNLSGKVAKSEIEKVFADQRVALHPELLKKLDAKGKGISYFSDAFGMFRPVSIARGKSVLQDKRGIFRSVETRYKVESEALASVFRIETNLGENIGSHRIFNALLTFSVLKNRRMDWAQKELASLLLLSSRNRLDVLGIRGSWAGAFGLCQFIPSSFLEYAKDGNGDGRIDLFQFGDAMESAANYLKVHGWNGDIIESKKKALFTYNRSKEYGEAVLAYAEKIR